MLYQSKFIISIAKDLLVKIDDSLQLRSNTAQSSNNAVTASNESQTASDVISYIDMKIKQWSIYMTQEQLEEKLKDFVLQHVSDNEFEEIQEPYLDEYGFDAINVMSPEYIVSFLRNNPESSIALDAEVFSY